MKATQDTFLIRKFELVEVPGPRGRAMIAPARVIHAFRAKGALEVVMARGFLFVCLNLLLLSQVVLADPLPLVDKVAAQPR